MKFLEEIEKCEDQVARAGIGFVDAEPPGLVEGIDDLSVHVELELLGRRVAHSDGLGALVPGQPRHSPLRQPAFSRGSVHDLQVGWLAGGSAQEPLAPGLRFVLVAGVDQREKCERRVSEPAEPVVPVADASDPFGKRGRGRGEDPARRCIRERLQCDHRSLNRLGPVAVVGPLLRPAVPPLLRPVQGPGRVPGPRHVQVRRIPSEAEGNSLPAPDRELGDGRVAYATRLDRCAQHERVRAGHGDQGTIDVTHPGDDLAVVESDREVHPHGDVAADPFDDADDVHGLVADRHEVDDPYRALGCVELGLEHERVIAVSPTRGAATGSRCDLPASVVLVSQERGEARAAVEPRCAQPVDRAVVADERGGLRIADHGVLLDSGSHCRGHRRGVRLSERVGCGPHVDLAPVRGTGVPERVPAWRRPRRPPARCLRSLAPAGGARRRGSRRRRQG